MPILHPNESSEVPPTKGVIIMANEVSLCVVGNLTDAPELRFTPSGAAVASFTVASTPRTFDKQSQEWKDGESKFRRVCQVADDGDNGFAAHAVLFSV